MLRMELLCATTGQRHHEFGAKEINRNFYHLEIVSPCYLFYSKHDFLNTIKNIYKTLNSPIFPNFRSQISSHLRSSPQGLCVCVYKYIYIHKKKKFPSTKKLLPHLTRKECLFDMKYKTKSQHEHGRIHQTY